MLNPSARNLYKPLLLVAALAFVYWNVLARLARVWWDDENYSHGLLIPFVVGYILWTERDRLASAERRPSLLLGGGMIAAALAALWAGTAGAELFMQRTSFALLVAGLLVYFFGARFLGLVAVPLLLLLLAIPVPTILFNKVAFPLQLFASRCAVAAMRLFDIPVLREGNVIELTPYNASTSIKLEVVEACSGIRSLMTLVTLAVVYAYFTAPSDKGGEGGGRFGGWAFWRSALIVAAAVPIAIVTNAARVSGTGILARFYGTQAADGFFHSFSGWVVYVTAFLLLFGFGWLVDRGASFGNRGGGGRGAGETPTGTTGDVEKTSAAQVADAHAIAPAPSAAMTVGTTDAP
ncbi:MAG TPA: exosortase/archaeosortase family protein [Pyrinomonadaceae bacterium]|nr:exosortase/archaeosortase family protein [Pyrinomonadaceae bacterium]